MHHYVPQEYSPTSHFSTLTLWNSLNSPEVILQMPGQPARAQNRHQTPWGLMQTIPPLLGVGQPPANPCTHGTGAPAPRCICLSVRKEAWPEISTALAKAGKGPFSFQSQRKAKECSNCHTVELISHASKVVLKILRARLQPYTNWEWFLFLLVKVCLSRVIMI